jgi:translation elongation factor EF-G
LLGSGWLDNRTFSVVTNIGMWEYTIDGEERQIAHFGWKLLHTQVAISPATPLIAIIEAYNEGESKLHFWNRTTATVQTTHIPELQPGNILTDIVFSQDGRLLAGWSSEGMVVWHVASGKVIRQWLMKHTGILAFFHFQFTPDSRHLLLILKNMLVMEITTGESYWLTLEDSTENQETEAILAFARQLKKRRSGSDHQVTRDSTQTITSEYNGLLQVRESLSGKELMRLEETARQLLSLSPDEQWLATTGPDNADNDEPLSALVFKILADKYGRLAFVRVYSGVLKAGTSVFNPVKNTNERIGRIVRMLADDRKDVEEVQAGDIAAIIGLKETFTGDTLCDPTHPVVLENIKFPDPVIEVAIEPNSKADQDKMGIGLRKLAEEDATFKVEVDAQLGQTKIKGWKCWLIA